MLEDSKTQTMEDTPTSTGENGAKLEEKINKESVKLSPQTHGNVFFENPLTDDLSDEPNHRGDNLSMATTLTVDGLPSLMENLSDIRDMVSRNSEKIQFFEEKHISIIEDSEAKLNAHEIKFNSVDSDIEDVRLNMLSFKARRESEDKKKEDRRRTRSMMDSYSFIMVKPWSIAAVVAWSIFLVQNVSFILVLTNQIDTDNESNSGSIFGLPKGADVTVHASQGIAIFLIILVQQSLWEATLYLHIGYSSHLKAQSIQINWWLISNLLRLTEGIVATFVTFMLVLKGDNVVNLFLDFTAMTFVSSFDNIIYTLASMKVLGKHMKDVVDECEEIEYNIKEISTKSSSKKPRINVGSLFRPLTVNFFLLVAMYVTWSKLILIPHLNGEYLCQSIFLQLDDNVNSQLSFFSGSYNLLNGHEKKGGYKTVYRENKDSLSYITRKPMLLQYCANIGAWVFVLEDESKDVCSENLIKAKSSTVSNQEKYDLFEVGSDGWYVIYKDGRFMPFEDFRFTCQDKSQQYDIGSLSSCSNIEVDEQMGPFVSTRTWSTHYTSFSHVSTTLPVSVYGHPVYISPQVNDSQDIIFYTGKRWIITSTKDLVEYDGMKQEVSLQDYLEKHFHGKWSQYKVAFFSEPIVLNSPQDQMTPTGLNWYAATLEVKDEKQEVEGNEKMPNIFICSSCDEVSNPCFNEGICLETRTCDCTSGSSGTLCQVLPTQNGICNEFFNKRQFDFDGGDCCINTCTNQNQNQDNCGFDELGLFYVGYDTCQDSSCTECWKKSNPEVLKSLSISYVSISANGRVIALIESITKTIRVYDGVGSNWVMRGSAVTSAPQPASDTVQISSFEFLMNVKDKLAPVTVAVLKDESAFVYDWNGVFWEEKGIPLFKNSSNVVTQIQLHDNGNSLGILYKNKSFKYFNRPFDARTWEEYEISVSNYYEMFSVENSGEKIILGNQSCIELYVNHDIKDHVCLESNIMGIKVSPKGETAAVLLTYEGLNGYIKMFNISDNKFEEIHSVIRGVKTGNAKVDVSDDGTMIAAHSTSDDTLRFYHRKNETWEVKQEQFSGNRISLSTLSTDNGALAVLLSHSLMLYHQNKKCGNGMSKLRLSFVPDLAPRELSWELIHFTPQNKTITLKKGGTYKVSESMVVQDVCVSDNLLLTHTSAGSCIGIKITDLGLNGLRQPGRVGISIGGKVIWSLNNTTGYENIYPVFGNRECMERLRRKYTSDIKKYEISMHSDCYTTNCEWNKIGQFSGTVNFKNINILSHLTSLSADGLVLAIGENEKYNATGEVRIFHYHNGGWEPHGLLRGAIVEELFGTCISLSADGSMIAIGSIGNRKGQIKVYMYEAGKRQWSLYGNIIDDTSSGLGLGGSISLSADGTVLAVGYFVHNPEACSTNIYKYDVVSNIWKFQPGCTKKVIENGRSMVEISSTGNYYVMSFPDASKRYFDAGFVQVYEHDDYTQSWVERGSPIQGEHFYHNLGMSMSISADGTILAVGGNAGRAALVYKFDEKDLEWYQLGQDISLKRPQYQNYNFDLVLSSCGSTLVISSFSNVQVFLYDVTRKLWVNSLTEFPFVASENPDPPARLAASADAVTIAIMNTTSLEIYRLQKKSGESIFCEGNSQLFNFTVRPDKFPEDISWGLQNSKGDTIIGGALPKSDTNNLISESITYTRCISNEELFYLFIIEDGYADGICCDWGTGTFLVMYDNKIVTYDKSPFSKKSLCLSQSGNFSDFSIVIGSRQGAGQDVGQWSLLDSSYKQIHGSQLLKSIGQADDVLFDTCLSSEECFTLRVISFSGLGIPFKVTYENHLVHENKIDAFNSSKVRVGNCPSSSCPNDQYLFELDLHVDKYPGDMTWKLLDPNNQTIFDMGNYTEELKRHYYAECLTLLPGKCLSFQIFDRYKDGGTNYVVWWDNKKIFDGRHNDEFDEIKIGDCDA